MKMEPMDGLRLANAAPVGGTHPAFVASRFGASLRDDHEISETEAMRDAARAESRRMRPIAGVVVVMLVTLVVTTMLMSPMQTAGSSADSMRSRIPAASR